jgi:hypothetical protein
VSEAPSNFPLENRDEMVSAGIHNSANDATAQAEASGQKGTGELQNDTPPKKYLATAASILDTLDLSENQAADEALQWGRLELVEAYAKLGEDAQALSLMNRYFEEPTVYRAEALARIGVALHSPIHLGEARRIPVDHHEMGRGMITAMWSAIAQATHDETDRQRAVTAFDDLSKHVETEGEFLVEALLLERHPSPSGKPTEDLVRRYAAARPKPLGDKLVQLWQLQKKDYDETLAPFRSEVSPKLAPSLNPADADATGQALLAAARQTTTNQDRLLLFRTAVHLATASLPGGQTK